MTNAFSGYFEDYEKQKIKKAVIYLKEKEHLELPNIQNDLTQMLNSATPAKDYFERRRFFPNHLVRDRTAYIESKFTNSHKITNGDIIKIIKENKNTHIEIKDKDFSDIFLENIKLLFGKSKYKENHNEYQYQDIIFSNCIFHNLNLSNIWCLQFLNSCLEFNFCCFIFSIFTAINFGRNSSCNQQIQKFLLFFLNISQFIAILF